MDDLIFWFCLFRERERMGMSLSSSFGDEGTTESLIPPLMERPEICGWEEYPNYILSDNRNRSKSKERTDRASPVRSRSRYVWLTDLSGFSYINNLKYGCAEIQTDTLHMWFWIPRSPRILSKGHRSRSPPGVRSSSNRRSRDKSRDREYKKHNRSKPKSRSNSPDSRRTYKPKLKLVDY